jgi:hypothetical protein
VRFKEDYDPEVVPSPRAARIDDGFRHPKLDATRSASESSLCAVGGGGKEEPAGTGEHRLQVVMLFNSRGRKRPSAFRETGIVSDNGPAGSGYNVSEIV